MTSVYVIAIEGGPVKVGIANNPQARLAKLRTGTPFPLRLVHIEDPCELGAAQVEKAAHALLAAARTQGEWFAVTVEEARAAIRDAIAGLRAPPPLPKLAAEPDITAAQVRAARGLVDRSQKQLAEAAGVGLSTIADFERGRRVPIGNNLQAIRKALEEAGVVFTNDDEPGVKLRKKHV